MSYRVAYNSCVHGGVFMEGGKVRLNNVFVFGKYQIPDSSDLFSGNYFVPVFSDE